MAKVEPLTSEEDDFWRSLMQIVLSLPRLLDGELMQAVGINSNVYITLMTLAEVPNRELRMTDLASATSLSASRVTRITDELQVRGLVTKQASASDGRSNVVKLTAAGEAKLEEAWGIHAACVRALGVDRIDRVAASEAARTLGEIARHIEARR